MHINRLLLTAPLAALLAMGTGCNSKYEPGENTASSVVVQSFSLASNDSVLVNLDQVYFSIDLVKAEIFNADSLPYGTRTDSLVPVIKTLENVAVANLYVPRPGQSDSIVDYIKNSTAAIDFSNGPVRLQLQSPDGDVERYYSLKVNVHRQVPDSMSWDRVGVRNLPSLFQVPQQQCTATNDNGVYCLTRFGAEYSLGFCPNPAMEQWDVKATTFPAGVDMTTLRGAGESLYILGASDGALYESSDGGVTWTDTNSKFTYLIGNYNGTLVGIVKSVSGSYQRQYYPSGIVEAIEEDFPVSGPSLPVEFFFPFSSSVQTMIVGGRTASGQLTSATWAYDGTSWYNLNSGNTKYALPVALEDMCLVPYFTFRTNKHWEATEYATLLAWGGKDINGKAQRTVYMSTDYGMTWQIAPSLLQLATAMPSVWGAQAVVYEQLKEVAPAFAALDLPALSPLAQIVPYPVQAEQYTTLATRPITQWECPYIYVFGGTGDAGNTYNTVWRGVINRLTYKPLQ